MIPRPSGEVFSCPPASAPGGGRIVRQKCKTNCDKIEGRRCRKAGATYVAAPLPCRDFSLKKDNLRYVWPRISAKTKNYLAKISSKCFLNGRVYLIFFKNKRKTSIFLQEELLKAFQSAQRGRLAGKVGTAGNLAAIILAVNAQLADFGPTRNGARHIP